MVRGGRLCGLLLAICGSFVSAAHAIEIDAGPKNRVAGYVVREDATSITIRVMSPDGKDKVTAYERNKIKIVHQVSKERLEKLAPADVKSYRAYADELAAKTSDPEARDVALRLYLIAAHLRTGEFGPSSMLKMAAIAPTEVEARRYKAMAVLLDPAGDLTALKKEPAKKGKGAATPEAKLQAALTAFQAAMRALRSGSISEAREAAQRDGVDKIFTSAPAVGDQKTFLKTCTDVICPTCRLKKISTCTQCNGKGKAVNMFGVFESCSMCSGKGILRCSACDGTGMAPLSDEQLRGILQAELWSVECLSSGEIKPGGSVGERGWSAAVKAPPKPVTTLTLETISEYDPRKCVFRNGAWTAP